MTARDRVERPHGATPAVRPGTANDEVDPGDLMEFVAAESAMAPVDDGVPGTGWHGRFGHLARQLVKFGLVGGAGFVIDMGLYNVLMLTVFAGSGNELAPIIAKVASTLVAITTNWIGNRLWTFRRHRRHDRTREAVEFFAVSLAGLVVGLLPLAVSRYVLGIDSIVADNVANVIGLGLGSAFRFALYRWWVFSPSRHGARA